MELATTTTIYRTICVSWKAHERPLKRLLVCYLLNVYQEKHWLLSLALANFDSSSRGAGAVEPYNSKRLALASLDRIASAYCALIRYPHNPAMLWLSHINFLTRAQNFRRANKEVANRKPLLYGRVGFKV